MSFKGLRGFKQSSVLSPKIRKMVESGLTPVRPSNTPLVPTLVLSFTSVDEGSATGRYVGTPYVVNGKGTYTITEIADPDNKFTITGGDLVTSASLDYGVETSHLVTLRASNGVDANIDQQFTINVNNVFEGVLGPVSANFYYLAAENAVITTITGLDSEVAESIAAISPNDGRLAFNANQILKGPSAVTEGVINAIVTTTQGRTLEIALTALDVSWANIGALFSGGADGVMYDFSDKSTMFQDVNGILPVTINDDPIGMILDQHKWGGRTLEEQRAFLPELLNNPEFTSDLSGWSKAGSGDMTWIDGKLRITASGTYFYQSFTTEIGRWYEATIVFTDRVGGFNPNLYIGTSAGNGSIISGAGTFTSLGVYRRWFKAISTTTFITVQNPTGITSSDWDEVSIKEIDGHHATQTTSSYRPTLLNGKDGGFGSPKYLITDFYFQDYDNFFAAWGLMVSSSGSYIMLGARDTSPAEYAELLVTNQIAGSNIGTGGGPMGTINMYAERTTMQMRQNISEASLYIGGVLDGTKATPGPLPDLAQARPLYIGCTNSNGTASSHWPGNIQRVVAGHIDLSGIMSPEQLHANMVA